MLKGTIDEFPLIDVLGILQARNKTGRLEIERQAGRGIIYVRLGEPYYAESSLTRSLIGQKLVDIGAITDMQLRKALDRQAESGERLGQILLTHGVISGEHIAAAVISQIKDALADLLAWEAGEFRWEAGAEVEVEVPLFGATIGSIDEGANPLAPHIVPLNNEEPDAAPEEPAQPEAVTDQPDFPQGGTKMTGDEVTAMPIETSPDAGQDSNLEIAHSSSEMEDETEPEEEHTNDPLDETEQEAETETEAESGLPPLAIEARAQTQPEAPPPLHAPRVIKSQPAPELDEEFEAVFEATEHVSFDAEPQAEPVAEPAFDAPSFDPPPVTDPVFGADAFKPIAPDNDFDPPTFESANGSADPIFDSANFEPATETRETAFEPVGETLDARAPESDTDTPEFEAPEPSLEIAVQEPVLEALEPMPDMVPPEPVEAAPEMPAADSMPVATSPPPPPDAPIEDAAEDAPAEKPAEAPAENPAAPSNGVAPESRKDIKLDRSSLVRELSDLLR